MVCSHCETTESFLYRHYFATLNDANEEARKLISDYYETGDPMHTVQIRNSIIQDFETSIEQESNTPISKKTLYVSCASCTIGITGGIYGFPIMGLIFCGISAVAIAKYFKDSSNRDERIRELRKRVSSVISDASLIMRVLDTNQGHIKMQLRNS